MRIPATTVMTAWVVLRSTTVPQRGRTAIHHKGTKGTKTSQRRPGKGLCLGNLVPVFFVKSWCPLCLCGEVFCSLLAQVGELEVLEGDFHPLEAGVQLEAEAALRRQLVEVVVHRRLAV